MRAGPCSTYVVLRFVPEFDHFWRMVEDSLAGLTFGWAGGRLRAEPDRRQSPGPLRS